MEDQSGMLHCSDIEPTIINEIECKEPFTPEVLDPNYVPPSNDSCVNYNQYYTECRQDGPNPFEEAISFDNIASAWIAIFQVNFNKIFIIICLYLVLCYIICIMGLMSVTLCKSYMSPVS